MIADGHHRYETALAYRDERRAAAGGDATPTRRTSRRSPTSRTPTRPGTLLLPIHRVVREVPAPDDAALGARDCPAGRSERVALPERRRAARRCSSAISRRSRIATPSPPTTARARCASSRDRARPGDDLSIRVLHAEVLHGVFGLDDAAVRDGAVAFPKHAPEAAREVRAGRGTRRALPESARAPRTCSASPAAGEILPQKSTFFHPKLPSGLVFRLLDGRDSREAARPPRAAPARRAGGGRARRSRPRRGVRDRAHRRSAGRRPSDPRWRAHCRPSALRGAVLEATVDSSVWCQELQLQRREILAALRRELGDAAPSDLRLFVG